MRKNLSEFFPKENIYILVDWHLVWILEFVRLDCFKIIGFQIEMTARVTPKEKLFDHFLSFSSWSNTKMN